MPLDKSILAEIESGEQSGRTSTPPDPEVMELLRKNIGKSIRLPRISYTDFVKLRRAFTVAANELDLLQINWRDEPTEGSWSRPFANIRDQSQKQARKPMSAEQRALAIKKAQETKAANKLRREQAKAAAEASEKANSQQRPQAVATGARRAS
jgi:hypothetical protein